MLTNVLPVSIVWRVNVLTIVCLIVRGLVDLTAVEALASVPAMRCVVPRALMAVLSGAVWIVIFVVRLTVPVARIFVGKEPVVPVVMIQRRCVSVRAGQVRQPVMAGQMSVRPIRIRILMITRLQNRVRFTAVRKRKLSAARVCL